MTLSSSSFLRILCFASSVAIIVTVLGKQDSRADSGDTKPSKDAPYAQTYRIYPRQSSVVFRIKHNSVSFAYGTFNTISGSYRLDAEHPKRNHVEVVIDASSIDTRHELRDKHLRGDEYLQTGKHAKIAFKSTKIVSLGENRFRVTGDLSLLGITKPLTVEVTLSVPIWHDQIDGHIGGISTEFSIDRTDFGMASQKFLSSGVDLFASFESTDTPKKKR